MGVITKNERGIPEITPIISSGSQETLYIPSSDDDRSVVSVATRHAQSRILIGRRVPTVGHEAGPKPQCGKKKSRRYQNTNNLMTLAEESEPHEVTIEDFVSSAKTPFSLLFEDSSTLQKWEDFVSSSEEQQEKMIASPSQPSTPRQPMKLVNRVLRTLLKKRRLPLGMVGYLEGELVTFFTAMPSNIYISPELSSFERMLLHSLSEYHDLNSMSYNTEPKKVRLVQVKNPKEDFPLPSLLLTDYLSSVGQVN